MIKRILFTRDNYIPIIILTIIAVMTSGYALTTVPQYHVYWLLLFCVPIMFIYLMIKKRGVFNIKVNLPLMSMFFISIPIVIKCLVDSSNIGASVKISIRYFICAFLCPFLTFDNFKAVHKCYAYHCNCIIGSIYQ